MLPIKSGQMTIIIAVRNVSMILPLNFGYPLVISSLRLCIFQTYAVNIEIKNPPSGKNISLNTSVINVIKSFVWLPYVMKFVHQSTAPVENMLGKPITKITEARIHDIFLRLNCHWSTANDTGTSSSEIVDVSAAKHNNKKNAPPIMGPIIGPIVSKTPGKVTNTNPGPEVGSSP